MENIKERAAMLNSFTDELSDHAKDRALKVGLKAHEFVQVLFSLAVVTAMNLAKDGTELDALDEVWADLRTEAALMVAQRQAELKAKGEAK